MVLLSRVRWHEIEGAPQDWAGTVTQVSPLLVLRDGMTTAVRVAVRLAPVEVGDRVMCRSVPTSGPGRAMQVVLVGVSGSDLGGLPAPVRTEVGTADITTSSWSDLALSTMTVTLPAPVRCQLTYGGFCRAYGGGKTFQAKARWSGALTGDSGDLGFGATLYLQATSDSQWVSLNATHPLTLPAGTTTFHIQGQYVGSGSDPRINYAWVQVTPLRWEE